MNYYSVFIATRRKISIPLVYKSKQLIPTGSVVKIDIVNQQRLAVVYQRTTQFNKSIEYKEIIEVFDYQIPVPLLRTMIEFQKRDKVDFSAIGQLLLPNFPIKASRSQLDLKPRPEVDDLNLTSDQIKVSRKINNSLRGKPQLLIGVTGSGKTRIYVDLVKRSTKVNLSSLILVPAIGLSQQIVLEFRRFTKQPIYHFHSNLSLSQKRLIWQSIISSQEPVVVIGPRSSLFLPIKNLGTIIMDEVHDDSYKQNNEPRYTALQIASLLAKQSKARLLVASATPSVSDYYHFQKRKYFVHKLLSRPKTSYQPQIQFAKTPIADKLLSNEAKAAIHQALKNKNQVLIYHNRRGSWQLIRCPECAWVARCSNCTNRFVFHSDKFLLMCHYCNKTARPKSVCRDCLKPLNYAFPGIKALIKELRADKFIKIHSNIYRFDSDNQKQKSLASKMEEIKTKRSGIIVGTGVVSRGLDLPHLEAVIIVDADQHLISADYRSQERTFQTIYQLVGRVGRGHLKNTKVIVQTTNTKSRLLDLATQGNYFDFYKMELTNRRLYKFPPFNFLANIYVVAKTATGSRRRAALIKKELTGLLSDKIVFYGPSPAFSNKRQGLYQTIIHCQSNSRSALVSIKDQLPDKAILDLDPIELFCGIQKLK